MDINKEKVNSFISAINWDRIWSSNFSSEDSFSYFRADESFEALDEFEERSGASKIVLINSEENFVIKVPLRYVYDDDCYNSETDEYEEDYIPLHGAPYLDNDDEYSEWNYCQSETEYYNLAKENGVAMFFAQTKLYCEEPYPIYVQEKCRNFWDRKEKPARSKEEIKERTSSLVKSASLEQNDWLCNFQNEWILDAVDAYGEETFFKFLNFLNDFHINDLHSSNYGYSTIDNRPVLIDFSGFND